MKTGVSSIDITPYSGCELSGFLARVQPSVGVHDLLLARALFMENEENRILWLHADLIGFEQKTVSQLRATLSTRLALSPSQIVVSATHTHSGPATIHLTRCGEYDENYLNRITGLMVQAAEQAVENVEDTSLFFAEGSCDLGVDRRKKSSAHVDHRVGIMGMRRPDGTYKAVWANYPMHNVGFGSDNHKLSADIFGQAASLIQETVTGSPEVLLTNGACGNVNPPSVTHDFEEVKKFGHHLGYGIMKALPTADYIAEHPFQIRQKDIMIELDTMSKEEIEQYSNKIMQPLTNRDDYPAQRYREAVSIWQRNIMVKIQNQANGIRVPVEIQVIRLGDTYWVCLGAEVFSRIADCLRQKTGKRVYVIGYANGLIGYLPTAEAYDEGGYEVETSFIFYNTFRPKKGSFEKVCDESERLIQEIAQ